MEKKEYKISLVYKKDGRLTQARLNLNKDFINYLGINEEEKTILLKYNDNIISIEKYTESDIINIKKTKDGKLFFETTSELAYEKKHYRYRLIIPLPVIEDFRFIDKVNIIKEKEKLIIKKSQGTRVSLENKDKEEKMGKIITLKVNKGGVGKTFLTSQIGHTLSLLGKKVLIITSDSQNNILNFLFKGNKEFKDGLKRDIKDEKGDKFFLRKEENGGELIYIPLEDNKFSNSFPKELKKYLEKKKKEFDYILIDSVPTMKIDETFLECSDKIIIPAFADEVTIEGIVNLLKEVDVNKVHAIILNKYEKTSVQKKYFELLKEIISETDIIFTTPIPKLSFIEKMLDNKKTIWEYNNKQVKEVQEILLEIVNKL